MSSDVDFDFIRRVRAAQGYVELGMAREALEELGGLSEGSQNRIEAVLMRMEILRFLEQWEECATMGQVALEHYGQRGELYLITAYAVRRSQGLERARELLLSGEPVLANEAMFHFNIACYECQLGNLNGAKQRLQRAFALDPKYRKMGREDPDLTALWSWLTDEA
jgi:tetratricopeptide (TPR) repeat protein